MKVIAINGSARKEGNTGLMLRTVLDQLKKEGIATEYFCLAGKVIEPCKACWVCGSTYWNMGYGQFPGDVLKDEEGMENMRSLGQNMAFLLKAVHREKV